jgi:hypothetical protein
MLKMPRVIGLTLCDRLEVDTATGEVLLAGLFQAQHFLHFPSPPFTFTVYTALFGGVGEGTMELTIQRLENEEDLYSHRRWLALPGRQLIVNLEIRVRDCVFPTPGRYSLTLRFDEQFVTDRLLDIHLG